MPPVIIRGGISIHKPVDSHIDKKRAVALNIRSCPIFNKQDQIAELRTCIQQVNKKIDCFSVDVSCSQCNTVFEAMGCFYQFAPSEEVRPSLTEEDIQRGSKKRELTELRRRFIRKKASLSLKCGSMNDGDCTRQAIMSKTYPRKFLTCS